MFPVGSMGADHGTKAGFMVAPHGGGAQRGALVTKGHLARSGDGLGSSAQRAGGIGSFSVTLSEGQDSPVASGLS